MLSHSTQNIHGNCETCKERLSNFELLRILAMLLVLLVHCNFFSLGHPTQEEAVNIPIPTFTRCVFESLCICCVNVFVLISGWFGINPSIKSLGNFWFQCVFFIVGIYVVMLIMGKEALSIYGIARCFLLVDKNWFIISYLLLYILSPVLNAFIKEASSRIYMVVLVAFFIFQFVYGWPMIATPQFAYGYSTISFIGLYLLARYIRLYPCKWVALHKNIYLSSFLVTILVHSIMIYAVIYLGLEKAILRIIAYNCPLVILLSVCLLLYFSKLHFASRWINRIAASCFAVYLLHSTTPLDKYFVTCVNNIYNSTSGMKCLLLLFGFAILVYMAALVIDQLRKYCWQRIWSLYSKQ